MDEKVIQNLPRDIVYMHASISKLSSFVRDFCQTSRTGGNIDSTESFDKDIDPEEDAKWQKITESTEIVVKIGRGTTGVPLIIIHGMLIRRSAR